MKNVFALFFLTATLLFAQMDTRLNNYPNGKSLYLKASIDEDAAFKLGLLYDNQIKDYKKAAYWYEKSYTLGSITAAFNMALMYHNLKTYDKAITWYKKAIEKNDKASAYNLAFLYDEVLNQYEKSIFYYKKAYNLGDIKGATNLGYLYDVILKNTEEGIKWYKKAAQGGDADAINNLNKVYNEQGHKIKSAAYIIALIAYGSSNEKVFNHLKNKRKLSDEEIKQAYQLQKTLDIPKHYYDAELEDNPTSKRKNPRGQR